MGFCGNRLVRFEGTLTTWSDDRGFGFLQPAQGGENIFVHVNAFRSLRGGRPQVGQRVSFEVERGPQGKKRARNVSLLPVAARPARPSRSSPSAWGTATLFAIPAFLIVYLVVSILWRPPLVLATVYAGASVVTFFAYAFDKSAAQRGAWRTSEGTLHLLALAGGWPGALIAQQWLRHKSSKVEFRAVFWVTVVMNVAGFVVLASPAGRGLIAG